MSWLDTVTGVLKTAKTVAPILSAFGLPGAKTVSEAVEAIQGDPERTNDEAMNLLAASVDNLEKRVKALEKKK